VQPLTKTPGPVGNEARKDDIFYQLEMDPLKEFNNHKLLCGFITSMGKIKSRGGTRLTQRSQRRIGKAIRRARQMGVIPWMSKNSDVSPLDD
jgi:small subunit ribosomal protein S18